MRKRRNHGGSAVEFALLLPLIASLLIGTMVYGTQLVKELELQQVARDTASMAARGVTFMPTPVQPDTGNQAIVSRLGQELGWPSTGGLVSTVAGTGVVYVSTIEYLDATCNSGTVCDNHDSWVFVSSVAFGNTSLRKSNFGAPGCTPGCWDLTRNDGSLDPAKMLKDPGAQVKNFTSLLTPSSNVRGFQPGQPAFLVEVAGVTGGWNGGSVGYAFSLF